MLKKNFISTNLSSENNLYLSNLITSGISKNKILMNLIFSKNNAYIFNLKSNLC